MSQPNQKTPLVGRDETDNLDRVRTQVDELKVVMKDNISRYAPQQDNLSISFLMNAMYCLLHLYCSLLQQASLCISSFLAISRLNSS